MVRFFGFCAGLVFVVALLVSALAPRGPASVDPTVAIHLSPKHVSWKQDGPLGLGIFGTYDRAQLQRGFQVYSQVCSACHGLDKIAFRNLEAIGFSEAQVKAIAKTHEIADVAHDTGEPITRAGLASDYFPSPYPNATAAAAAHNGAAPPDLSLIIKARHDGARYVYSLLTGYGQTPPKGFDVPPTSHFNPYFAAVNIAMPQVLFDDQVEYSDGTPTTIDQEAKDVVAFLQWAAQPELEQRRRTGVAVMIYLALLSVLAWLAYRRVWAGVKH